MEVRGEVRKSGSPEVRKWEEVALSAIRFCYRPLLCYYFVKKNTRVSGFDDAITGFNKAMPEVTTAALNLFTLLSALMRSFTVEKLTDFNARSAVFLKPCFFKSIFRFF